MPDYPTVVTDQAQQSDEQNQLLAYMQSKPQPGVQQEQGMLHDYMQGLGDPVDAVKNAVTTGVQQVKQTVQNATRPAAGDIAGWRQVIQSQLPQDLQNDAGLVNTILAGGYAESGLDPSRRQQGGNGVGFFQFDTGGGMGTGVPDSQLTDEAYQAARIIPQYVQAWQNAPAGLSPAEKASWVAAQAERPYDYQNPNSAARRNYANAFNVVSGAAGGIGNSIAQGVTNLANTAQQAYGQYLAPKSSAGQPIPQSSNSQQDLSDYMNSLGDPTAQATQSGLSAEYGANGSQTDQSSILDTASNAIDTAKQTGQNLLSGATNALDQAGQAYTSEVDKLNQTLDPNYNPQAEQAKEQQAFSSPQNLVKWEASNAPNLPQFLQNAVASPLLGSAYAGIESLGQKLTGGQQRPFEQNLPSDPAQAALVLGQRWNQGQDISQLPANQQGLASIEHGASDLLNPAWQALPAPGLSVKPLEWLNEVVAPAKNAAPEVQDALRTFANRRLESAVTAETWGQRAAQTLGNLDVANAAEHFERTGQFVPNPTPEQNQLANDVRDLMTRTGIQGRTNGYIAGDVTARPGVTSYFPHVYQENLAPATSAARKAGLNPRDFYSNARIYDTLGDAVAAGLHPVDSVSQPLQHYVGRVMDSEAKYQLVQDLKNASPSAAMDYRPGDQLPPGWVRGETIDRQFAPKPVSVLDAQGNPLTVFSNGTAFSPEAAAALKNILSPSSFRGLTLVRGAQNLLGTGKETLFTLSGFHLITELRQAYRANGVQGIPVLGKAVWNAVVPGAFDRFRMGNADLFHEAARAGVTGLARDGSPLIPDTEGMFGGKAAALTRAGIGAVGGGASGYETSKAAGEDEATARQRALVGAAIGAVLGPTVGKVTTDALWERAVPTLKVLTYAVQKAAGRDPQQAASFVNNVYGGQNLAAIARSKTVQDVLRLGMLAPDWWEGWARQVGNAVRPNDLGGMSRAYWLRTAAIDGAFILEGLNYALNGHFTDQNQDHPFDLELTGLYDKLGWDHRDPKTGAPQRVYMDVLGPIRSILSQANNPGRFVTDRAGLVPRMVGEAMSNRDFRGQQIVPPYTPPLEAARLIGSNVLSQVAPIGGQQVEFGSAQNEPAALNAFSTVTGMRTIHPGKAALVWPGISDQNRALLEQSGVKYNPTAVGDSIEQFPLSVDERTAYQTEVNHEMDQIIPKLVSKPGWKRLTPTQRTALFKEVENEIHQSAGAKVLKSIPRPELKTRLAVQNHP